MWHGGRQGAQLARRGAQCQPAAAPTRLTGLFPPIGPPQYFSVIIWCAGDQYYTYAGVWGL